MEGWLVSRRCGQDGSQFLSEKLPCLGFLLRIVVMQIMAAYLGSSQQVVLAAVDDLQCYTELLHHGGACAAQVVRRPLTLVALAQY